MNLHLISHNSEVCVCVGGVNIDYNHATSKFKYTCSKKNADFEELEE